MEDWKAANPGKPEGEGGAAMLNRMNRSHKPLRDWGFPHLDWKADMRILDIGCGGGAAIHEMSELSKDSIIHGVDYSADSVKCAGEYNAAQLNKRVFITKGDVSALPYEDEQYDLVTAIETIYFWPDLQAGLEQIHRVLKTGGQIAILCEVDGPERMDWEKVNFELTVYTPAQVCEALKSANFKDIQYDVNENGYLIVYADK